MREIFIVGAGGFFGSALRYKLSGWILHHSGGWKFPLSTFCVNLLGCFAIGVLVGLVERHSFLNTGTRLFLFTGVLGGFTTFSAIGLETMYLVRTGAWQVAVANVLLSVTCCLVAVFLGWRMV